MATVTNVLGSVLMEIAQMDKPKYPSFLEDVVNRLADVEQKFEAKQKQFSEDYGKLRIRVTADIQQQFDSQKFTLIKSFLEVLDYLELAMQHAGSADAELHSGLDLVVTMFKSKLSSFNVEEIEVLAKPFNPEHSEAVGVIPVETYQTDGFVLATERKGYSIDGKLLRPARVRVGRFTALEQELLICENHGEFVDCDETGAYVCRYCGKQ